MKNLSFHPLILIFCLIVLFSCSSKDDDLQPCSTAWAADLQEEISAVSDAVVAYALEQSTANCNALKAAYQGYIDVLKPYGNCATLTGQNRTDWEKALSEAEANVASIC